MPRIPILKLEDMTTDQKRVHDEIIAGPRGAIVGPFLAVIHRAELADPFQKLGAFVRYSTVFPLRLSELVILVTARRWKCGLEWGIHSKIALGAGLEPEIVEAIRRGETPLFADKEAADLYEFTRQVHEANFVTDAAYAAIKDRWDTVGAVELVALIGYYTMVAMTLNAHQIALEGQPADPFA
jgi:4-carboxymuconolactone decarboxylase